MCTPIFGSSDFTLRAPLAEARTYQYARHAPQQHGNVSRRQLLAVDKVDSGLYIIIYTRQVQALADALVGILKFVLTHQPDMHLAGCLALLVQEVVPRFHDRCFTNGHPHLPQDSRVESLPLHTDRHLVDARHVLALYHTLQVDIAERCHLHAQKVVQVALRAQHQYVGLYAHPLQFLHRVLCGLDLQLVGSL